MARDNNATRKRRELLVKVAHLAFSGTLREQIDRVPLERYPKQGKTYRCCIHHSRAIVRQRLQALLGFSCEEADELQPLAAFADTALRRPRISEPILTVADEACSACVRANYFVTNACRGCLARPCTSACPKQAIAVREGRAQVDAAACVSCGQCQKVCPYHAIIYMPIPCEEACPVGAISQDCAGKEHIDYAKCIYCGKCKQACPFGAIMEKSQIVDVISALRAGRRVTALLAPAIAGQFPATLGQIIRACRDLGCTEVIEVAHGADLTARCEAEEYDERMRAGEPFMTSSCCPAYFEAVRKHIPALQAKVSVTRTPMHYAAAAAKERAPETLTVFVGPCVAKRKEGVDDPLVDYVLTFEELGALCVARGIDVGACADETPADPAQQGGRGFALAGGVVAGIAPLVSEALTPCQVNGLDRKALAALKAYAKTNRAPGTFVEVMACSGGCIAGPGVITPPALAEQAVRALAAASAAAEPAAV